MGAFDGIKIPYDDGYPIGGYYSDPAEQYVKGQPAFNFTKSFTVKDLCSLLEAAESAGRECLWVPKAGSSGIRLDTWYARALLKEYTKLQIDR